MAFLMKSRLSNKKSLKATKKQSASPRISPPNMRHKIRAGFTFQRCTARIGLRAIPPAFHQISSCDRKKITPILSFLIQPSTHPITPNQRQLPSYASSARHSCQAFVISLHDMKRKIVAASVTIAPVRSATEVLKCSEREHISTLPKGIKQSSAIR